MLEMVREKNSFLGSEKTVRPDDVSRSGCDFTGFWVWRTDLEILPVLNSDTDYHHHQTLKPIRYLLHQLFHTSGEQLGGFTMGF